MSLSETMTALMDKAREITGLTEKINIAQLTSLMNHFDLHVNPNLLDKTEYVAYSNLQLNPYFMHTDIYKILKAGTYTFSWRAKTEGNARNIRINVYQRNTNNEIGQMNFPITNELQSSTFTVPEGGYYLCIYPSGSGKVPDKDVTLYDCKLEVGDLATPLNQVGGVTKAFLYALRRHFSSSLIGGVA